MDEIRTLKAEELDESIALSCFAFQYELTPEEWRERKAQTNPDRVWGYFTQGKMAAKMAIHDLRMYVQGKPYLMGGVASVATWPEYRRSGMVAALLRHGLKRMKEEGRTLSCLHPFAVPFYRKYGWELYTDYKTYELTNAQLPREQGVPGQVRRSEGDWELLGGIYDRFARTYNGTIVRDESWWLNRVFKQKGRQAAVYYDESGEARGYMLYSVRQRVMEIGEMVHLDDTARRGLWRFISNHDSMCEKVKLKAPADDELPFLLPDPRIKQETVPYFMARIVDFVGFVSDYAFEPPGDTVQLLVRLSDADAPWNDGLFRITVDENGRASAERVREEAMGGNANAEICACGIGTMTAMLMGYKRPAFMHKTGQFQGPGHAIDLWETLIPRRSTYLPDYY